MTSTTVENAGVVPQRRFFQSKLRWISRNSLLAFGLFVIFIYLVLMAIGPMIASYDPTDPNPKYTLAAPSAQFPFGTDKFGRDVLSRMLYAARLDLSIAFSVSLLSFVVGSIVGAIVGYYGGWIDRILMRFVDAMMSFPSFILAMAITSALGNTVPNVIFAVATAYTLQTIRLTRGEMMKIRTRQYADAAIAVGNPSWRVALLHLLPNALSPALVQLTLVSGWAILDVSGLAFLGLGIAPPTPEWGLMVSEGAQRIISGEYWVWLFPGIAIALIAFAFNLVGDGLRDIIAREEQ